LRLSSKLDEAGALQYAEEALRRIGIDVVLLEKEGHATVVQATRVPPESNGRMEKLPIFAIEWRGFPAQHRKGGRERVIASATIFSATPELVEFHVLDEALFVRPGIRITDETRLLGLSDKEFEAITPLQRSNLVFSTGQWSGTGSRHN
jgi:hypothetical protein